MMDGKGFFCGSAFFEVNLHLDDVSMMIIDQSKSHIGVEHDSTIYNSYNQINYAETSLLVAGTDETTMNSPRLSISSTGCHV